MLCFTKQVVWHVANFVSSSELDFSVDFILIYGRWVP